MPKSSKYIVPAIFSLIAVALYCFWAIPYRAAMGYREELQLFQTTAAYFAGLMAVPGGMAVYIGEFCTQFFNNYMIGAAVMAGIMTAFMLLCYAIIGRQAPRVPKPLRLAFSFIPLLSLWLTLGNQNVTLAFPVALIMVVGAALVHSCASRTRLRGVLLMLVLTSLLYWLAGPAACVLTLLIIITAVRQIRYNESIQPALRSAAMAVAAVIWLGLNIWIWSLRSAYPFTYQLLGTGYLLEPGVCSPGIVITMILTAAVSLPAMLLWRVKLKIALPALMAAEAAAALLIYPKAWPEATYRLIDYDYMVRANDWEGILRYSDRHDPDLPLSVSATNLALAMTGQLDARAFDYYQNGPGGLIPSFRKESISSWLTGEIFFQLGLVNSAQRFYFEGMEAIPNFNKSARAMKRLAETAMLRGDYEVAEKYLRILQNTLFYGKWATRTLALIRNPKEIDSHPLYGALRRRMIDDDALFSDANLDGFLARLYTRDPGNDVARQYLIVYPLMERDLAGFAEYMALVAGQRPEYNPPLAQQALAFMAMKSGRELPANAVPPAVEQSLRGFAQAWTSKNQALIDGYRRTLFYYLLSDE
ncbi:MAG: hypothetical protein K2K93_02935 [Muribaculaceae bacterium]|nr:hypothetical protein [Muribaculaceae bacterium]